MPVLDEFFGGEMAATVLHPTTPYPNICLGQKFEVEFCGAEMSKAADAYVFFSPPKDLGGDRRYAVPDHLGSEQMWNAVEFVVFDDRGDQEIPYLPTSKSRLGGRDFRSLFVSDTASPRVATRKLRDFALKYAIDAFIGCLEITASGGRDSALKAHALYNRHEGLLAATGATIDIHAVAGTVDTKSSRLLAKRMTSDGF